MLKKFKKFIFFFISGKILDFSIKTAFFSLFLLTETFLNVTIRYSVKNCVSWLYFETSLTQGGKSETSVLPEYDGSTMGVHGSTMGVHGSTMGVDGSTMGVPWE